MDDKTLETLAGVVKQAAELNLPDPATMAGLSVLGTSAQRQEIVANDIRQAQRDEEGRYIVRTEQADGYNVVYMYGPLSSSEYSGLTSSAIMQAFSKDKPNLIRINSSGGNVWESISLQTEILQRRDEFTAQVDSMCASAAVNVLVACGQRRMGPSAQLLVHEVHGMANGRAKDLRDMADVYDTLNATLADVYAEATGADKDKLKRIMDEDRMMPAAEAAELGFVDEVIQPEQKSDDADAKRLERIANAARIRAEISQKYVDTVL